MTAMVDPKIKAVSKTLFDQNALGTNAVKCKNVESNKLEL